MDEFTSLCVIPAPSFTYITNIHGHYCPLNIMLKISEIELISLLLKIYKQRNKQISGVGEHSSMNKNALCVGIKV